MHTSGEQTPDCFIADKTIRFEQYKNAAGEVTYFQAKWNKSEEEEEEWEGESVEDK